MRLILDTNLWISFLISSKYEKLYELLTGDKDLLVLKKTNNTEIKTISEFFDVIDS